MENKDLMERLEGLLEKESRLEKNGNWGSEMSGRSGNYFFYSLTYIDESIKYEDLVGSHQWIHIKEYMGNRSKGKYCVLSDKSYDFDNLDEVIAKVKEILPDN